MLRSRDLVPQIAQQIVLHALMTKHLKLKLRFKFKKYSFTHLLLLNQQSIHTECESYHSHKLLQKGLKKE